MFSRLARSISKKRLLSSRFLPSLSSSQRIFNSGSIRFDSTLTKNYDFFKKEMDDAHAKSLKARDESVVGQYGWVPFYGMIGVIFLSKEIVVVGTEFMLFSAFLSFFATSYILLGETVTKMSTEILAENKTKFDHLFDWSIANLRVYKAKTEVEVDTVSVLENMLKQQREVEKMYIAAQNLQQRHEFQQAIIDKLTQIKIKEDAEAALERSQLIDTAVANVYKSFTEDTGPLREAALVNAISLLGTDGSTTLEEDPVKKLFVKEFQ